MIHILRPVPSAEFVASAPLPPSHYRYTGYEFFCGTPTDDQSTNEECPVCVALARVARGIGIVTNEDRILLSHPSVSEPGMIYGPVEKEPDHGGYLFRWKWHANDNLDAISCGVGKVGKVELL